MKMKMMIWMFGAGLMLLSACQKDLDYFIPDPLNAADTVWTDNISDTSGVAKLRAALLPAPVLDSFPVTSGYDATEASGLRITIPAFGLFLGSLPAAGVAQLERRVVLSKGDAIRNNIPSLSDGSILTSGGSAFFRLSQGGVPLSLSQDASIVTFIPAELTADSFGMYIGESSAQGFNWVPDLDTSNKVVSQGQGYALITRHMGWSGANRVAGLQGMVSLHVSLPANYTNANTLVYAVFDNINTVLPLRGDVASHSFISGALPIDQHITLVVLSRQVDDYYLADMSVITTNNESSYSLEPVRHSFAEVQTFLDSL